MLSVFKRPSVTKLSAGFDFQNGGIGVALVERRLGKKPMVKSVSFHACENPKQQPDVLKHIVSDLNLKGVNSIYAMDPNRYSILQVDAPEVGEDELCKAIRWRVKDLLDFHIDDAVIDVFDLPKPKREGVAQMLSVVATRTSDVRQQVDLLESAGVSLGAIDIAELAVRNVAVLPEHGPGAQLFLYLSNEYGLIEILNDGLLYLCRRIEVDSSEFLKSPNETSAPQANEPMSFDMHPHGETPSVDDSPEPQDELMESLLLEVQRSMDYYEAHYGNGPVNEMHISSVDRVITERFLSYARGNMRTRVHALNINDQVDGLSEVSDDLFGRCLPALGAALRVES